MYLAARDAALAGWGPTNDKPALREDERKYCQSMAIAWLNGVLRRWSADLVTDPHMAPRIRWGLRRMKNDPALRGLRDEAGLANLSADQRKACAALWAEADTLLRRASRDTRRAGPPVEEWPANPFEAKRGGERKPMSAQAKTRVAVEEVASNVARGASS
jgi:hypothetical protein